MFKNLSILTPFATHYRSLKYIVPKAQILCYLILCVYPCSARLGRIAMIATLMAGYVLTLSGAETIEWLDRHQSGAWLVVTHIEDGGSS